LRSYMRIASSGRPPDMHAHDCPLALPPLQSATPPSGAATRAVTHHPSHTKIPTLPLPPQSVDARGRGEVRAGSRQSPERPYLAGEPVCTRFGREASHNDTIIVHRCRGYRHRMRDFQQLQRIGCPHAEPGNAKSPNGSNRRIFMRISFNVKPGEPETNSLPIRNACKRPRHAAYVPRENRTGTDAANHLTSNRPAARKHAHGAAGEKRTLCRENAIIMTNKWQQTLSAPAKPT